MQVSVGSRLGPYQILARLGAGGMGEVWKARDTRLDREVAIKILPEEFARSAQLRLRFEREAKTISQLNHPNICTLHDVGDDYLVMELLEGETLADRIARSPLPLAEVLRYGAQIAEALDRAHRAGVVHRDLKPANVMLTKSGAKLLDFGLAKSGAAVIELDASTQHKPLTAEGTILGTFQYMSPEQLEGVELDGRSDIFALGVLLYEMTTGRRAFEGSTKTSLIAAIIRGEPRPVNEIQPLTPPALEHVIAKCLEKSRDDRWQSAHDVASELRWIGELGSSAGVAAPFVARRKRSERLAWMTALLLLVPLAALVTWRATRVERERAALSVVPPLGITYAFNWGTMGSLTISPDGRHITFPAVEKGRQALYLRRIDAREAREIPGTAGTEELFPFWSPDSRSIAFFAQGKLKRVDLAGSPPVVICDAPKGRSGDWNDEGTIIFSPDSVLPIHRVSADGGKPVPVTALNAAQKETTHRWATFLPDGRRFLYMAGTHIAGKSAEGNAIYLASLDGGAPKLLLRARSNVVYNDGHLLFVRDQALLAQPFDAKKGVLSGDPFPVAPRVEYAAGYFRATFSVSRNGTLVYRDGAVDSRTRVVLLDREGKQTATVGEPADILTISAAPDGRRVAVSLADDSGLDDIWIHDLQRNARTRFTFGSGSEHSAVWSADGRSIVYSDERRGVNEDVYVKSLTGGAGERRVAAADVPNEHYTPTSWSADGRHVLASHRRGSTTDQRPEVVVIPMSGDGKPQRLIPAPAWDARFSPDGRWVAWESDESGRRELYVTQFPQQSAKWQVTTDGVRGYRWVGGEILFAGYDGVLRSVDIDVRGAEPVIGVPRQLFAMASNVIEADVLPGGKQILVNLGPDEPPNSALSVVTNWSAQRRD